MDEEPTNPAAAQPRDAIDVDDLVFAATGRRVRRLTLPDGTHWFPAAELGVTMSDFPASRGVPDDRRDTLASLTGRFGIAAPTEPGWSPATEMVDLSVVMMLALGGGGGGGGGDPFRVWVADVLTAVQRDGCHFLDEATVQPRGAAPGTGYAMPGRLAEAVVRLEEPCLPQDAAFAEDSASAPGAAPRFRAEAPVRSAPEHGAHARSDGGAVADAEPTPDAVRGSDGAESGTPGVPPDSGTEATPARGETASGLVPAPRVPRDASSAADPGGAVQRRPAVQRPRHPEPRQDARPASGPARTGPGRRYDRRRAARQTAEAAEPRAEGLRAERLRDATGALRDLVAAQERSSRALARIAEALERFSGRPTAPEDPFCRTAGTPRVPLRGWSPASVGHLGTPSAAEPRSPQAGGGAVADTRATAPTPATPGPLTPEARRLFTRWRARLTVTDDIWTVARVLAEDLAAHGEARRSTAELARLCHLSERRVADSVLFLLRRNAIRQAGTAFDGTAVYVLSR